MKSKFFGGLILTLILCLTLLIAPNTFSAGDLYVAPNGSPSNPGTISQPTTLASAITRATAGTTIWMRGGTYNFSSTIQVDRGNDGSSSARKNIFAYGSEKPVLDFSGQSFDSSNRGLQIFGHYWHVRGLEIKNAGDNGVFIGGNYNIIENCVIHDNRDSGLQISRYSSSCSKSEWPSYNLILNCYSYNNFDPDDGEDADGFAPKLTCGPGNVFDGCIAAYNVDDGWDLYTKSDTGAIGAVTLKNCISHNNGKTTTGQGASDGDKNGYKLGGESISVNHIVENCIAFNNINHGFTYNRNTGSITMTNCTAYNNAEKSGKYNYNFPEGSHVAKNCLSYKPTRTSNNDHVSNLQDYQSSNIWWINGAGQSAKGLNLTDSDFVSLNPPTSGGIVIVPRNADGSPNLGNFLKIASNSDLVGAGVNGATIGANLSSGTSYTPIPTNPPSSPLPTQPQATPTPAPTVPSGPGAYQAEDAYYSNAIFEDEHSGYTGSGYVNYDNETGGYIQWTVNVAASSSYTVTFRFANGTSSNRAMDIYVNGSRVVSNLAFNGTGAWASWNTQSVNVNLNSGNNTIRATAITSNGGPNVDKIDISGGVAPTPTPTTPQATATPTPTSGGGVVYNGYYQMRNVGQSSMYIDGMGRTDNGSNLSMWANTTHYNSHWEIINVGGNYYQLKNRSTGLFIDGMGNSSSGSVCCQWANTTHYNSHWEIIADGSNVRFRNRSTGLYLDSNGQTSNGADVVQNSGNSSSNQRWTIISVSGGTSTPTPQPTTPPATATPTPTNPPATPVPTTPGGSVLFSDDFESGNYNNWNTQNGSWSITTDGSKVLRQSSTSAEGRAWAKSGSSADQSVQARVKVTNFNGNQALVCARMADGNNYYAVAIKSGSIELRKKISGSTSVLTSKSMSFSTNTWYTIRLDVVGNTLTAYVNGTQQLSTTTTGRTSGVAGLIAWKAAVNYDDVVVTSDGGTPQPTPTQPPGPTPTNPPGPTPTNPPGPTPTPPGGGGPVPSGLVGFATLNGGTTGGQGGPTVTVSTGTALQDEIKKGGPRIIRVSGTITTSNSSDSKINVKDVDNITIIGVGTSGEFNGIGIKVTRANNIILQNLRIHHVRSGDKDCISIEGPVNNIWVDHCELYNQFQGVDKDYYDALLDTKKNAAYHTFSWNKLHDSWKASLAGSSESDTSDRRVTYHHNSFININSLGDGKIDVFDPALVGINFSEI